MHWYSKTRNISVLSKKEIRLSKKLTSNCSFGIKVEFNIKSKTSDTFSIQNKKYRSITNKTKSDTSTKLANNCSFGIKVEFDVKFRTSDTFLCKQDPL